jgi:hypothetical protein
MSLWIENARYLLRRKSLQNRDYRLSILATGFKRAFKNFDKEMSARGCQQIERILVRTGNQRLRCVSSQWWTAFSDAVAANDGDYADKEARMLELCAALPRGSLHSGDWLELYRICLISGLFVVGINLRQRAEDLALKEASAVGAPKSVVRRALSVMIERGNFDEARRLLQVLHEKKDAPDLLEHACWLLQLLSGEKPLAYVPPDRSPVETSTLQSMRGAQIALVGPVPVSSKNGSEIDAFDLVAKFNYRGGVGGLDPETQGRRVDIAYYNLQQAKFIARKSDPSFFSEVSFPVFIKDKGSRLLGRWTASGRVLLNLQWLLFDSELNAGPNAIFDLLRFSPSSIKVFNTDLMLTAGRFKGYSQPGGEEINYSHSFAKTHDPLMQFRWVKLAWSCGLIDGDDRFRDVMKIDEAAYIRLLQDGHGAIARENLRGWAT